MSFEETLESLIRKVVREEIRAIAGEDRLLTAEQAAETLGYTDADSVRRLAREGHLEVVNLGAKARRFRNSDVQRLIQQGLQ